MKFILLALGFVAFTPVAGAQNSAASQEEAVAYLCSSQGMFDFLLGDWRFTGTRKTRDGTTRSIHGLWSATKSADGPLVTDEFRILDDSGKTTYVSTTWRAIQPMQKRWAIIGIEPYNGVAQIGTAWQEGGMIRIDQEFSTGGGNALWRIRYYDIRADTFLWRADRSLDTGRTWMDEYMTMRAARIGQPGKPVTLTAPDKPLENPYCK